MSHSARRALFALAVGASAALPTAHARPVRTATCSELARSADLVVIATPVAQRELPERTVFPGVTRGGRLPHCLST